MREAERLADQLERAYAGEAWHGPALGELVDRVDAAGAAARPVPGAHSIWEIVRHVTTWNEVPRRRIAGEAPEVSVAEDWPAVEDTSAAAWEAARAALGRSHAALHAAVLALDDSRLPEAVAGGATVYATVLGVIQHDVYHAGQIALLHKAAAAGTP